MEEIRGNLANWDELEEAHRERIVQICRDSGVLKPHHILVHDATLPLLPPVPEEAPEPEMGVRSAASACKTGCQVAGAAASAACRAEAKLLVAACLAGVAAATSACEAACSAVLDENPPVHHDPEKPPYHPPAYDPHQDHPIP